MGFAAMSAPSTASADTASDPSISRRDTPLGGSARSTASPSPCDLLAGGCTGQMGAGLSWVPALCPQPHQTRAHPAVAEQEPRARNRAGETRRCLERLSGSHALAIEGPRTGTSELSAALLLASRMTFVEENDGCKQWRNEWKLKNNILWCHGNTHRMHSLLASVIFPFNH